MGAGNILWRKIAPQTLAGGILPCAYKGVNDTAFFKTPEPRFGQIGTISNGVFRCDMKSRRLI
jgi:hypothetical protein